MTASAKPSWEKSSLQLVTLFGQLSPKNSAVTEKLMFGCPCCFANGNLFCGLHKQGMIFRLPEADRLAFLKLKDAANFEPMPGRKMKNYVILQNPPSHDHKELSRWMGRSLDFALTLPPKIKAKDAKKSPPKKKTRG